MNKYKWNYIVYIILISVALAVLGGFYLGKSFGVASDLEVEAVDEKTEIKNTDANYLLAKDAANNLIKYLNGIDTVIKDNLACNVFLDRTLDEYRFLATDNYNFLNDVAPFVLACSNNYHNIVTINDINYLVFNEEEYSSLQEQFNVTLKKIKDTEYSKVISKYNEYYYGGKFNTLEFAKSLKYKLMAVEESNGAYTADILITDTLSNEIVSRGKMAINITDNKVYYEAFIVNIPA